METSKLSAYTPACDRLVCIDSDGCVFDTMELKHKECFCPVTVQYWDLQPISKYARDAWDYGNLYSKDRGRSRFHELVLMFDLLADRKEVKESGFQLPDITSLREWVATSPMISNEGLEGQEDPVLKRTLEWSLEANRRIAEMVRGVPPFPGVRKSLQQLQDKADIAIVSATPRGALQQEWTEHGLMEAVRQLCGQEDGNKKQCIRAMAPHYKQGQVLMIGDAPGDMEAAKANEALFYPIVPGKEIESWKEFAEHGAMRFLQGTFAGDYENECISQFEKSLPDSPPWKGQA